MFTREVEIALDGVDADAAWRLLGDLTNISWMPPTQRVELFGSGVGMRRRLYGASGSVVGEHLLRHDDEHRQMVYRVEENNPLPADPYTVTATVEASPDGCTVRWTVDFVSTEEDKAKVIAGIDAVYSMIAGWLRDAAQ